MSQPDETPPEEENQPFQFGLRKIFLVTFIWAIFCTVTASLGAEAFIFAVGICTVSTGIIFIIADRDVPGTWLIFIGLFITCLGRGPI